MRGWGELGARFTAPMPLAEGLRRNQFAVSLRGMEKMLPPKRSVAID
jgi:hypothetical protein